MTFDDLFHGSRICREGASGRARRTVSETGVILLAAAAVHIIEDAGGVGSIAIQLLRNLTAISKTSRPEPQAWLKTLGAHHLVDRCRLCWTLP